MEREKKTEELGGLNVSVRLYVVRSSVRMFVCGCVRVGYRCIPQKSMSNQGSCEGFLRKLQKIVLRLRCRSMELECWNAWLFPWHRSHPVGGVWTVTKKWNRCLEGKKDRETDRGVMVNNGWSVNKAQQANGWSLGVLSTLSTFGTFGNVKFVHF